MSESRKRRSSAEDMAKSQKEISVSEFFAKNRHLLGFDNPRKALLATSPLVLWYNGVRST